jgi:hypothetical protein
LRLGARNLILRGRDLREARSERQREAQLAARDVESFRQITCALAHHVAVGKPPNPVAPLTPAPMNFSVSTYSCAQSVSAQPR